MATLARRLRLPLILGAIALVAGGSIVWHKHFEEHFFPKRFGVVEEGRVYRSGQLTTRMLRQVCSEQQIRTIIALNGDDPESATEAAVAKEIGVGRHTFSLSGDGTGDPAAYAEAVRLMADPANQPVLVHCGAGAQRAGAAAILYEHLVHGRPIAEIYPESFDYGHKPKEWILLAYLADHLDEIRAAYESGGAGGTGGAEGRAQGE